MDFAELDDIVYVTYTIKYRNGDVFDSNVGKKPVKFKLGAEVFVKGFEKEILGMRIGDIKTVTIPPEEAFGAKRDDLIFNIPLANVPAHINKKVGQRIEVKVEGGNGVYAEIIKVTETYLVVDANPRQAGQHLILTLKLEDIEVDIT